MPVPLNKEIKEGTLNCACVSVSACRSRSWTFQETSQVNCLMINTYELAQQRGSYMPNNTGKSKVADWSAFRVI